MSFLGKMVSRNRIRKAAKELAGEANSGNYVSMAREYVIAGNTDEVLRVCTEGLQLFPNDAELRRLGDRARQLQVDQRIRTLQAQLAASPRSAIWRELTGVLLSASRLDRAEQVATEWFEATEDGDALYSLARVHAERFYLDRRSKDGLNAYEMADHAKTKMKDLSGPIHLQFHLASRCGAWTEARGAVARLLELRPGDPTLEANFRYVLAMAGDTTGQNGEVPSLEMAMRRVESSGRFVDDTHGTQPENSSVSVRPMLQELSADADVRAAIYLRGGTALVQGPRGATAERTARAVRGVVQASRDAARRLGLGQTQEVLLEGTFGSLLVAPADQASCAVWCAKSVKREHEELLKKLSGMAGRSRGRLV
ncbi:MAG: tetratricopeptide (TPR) repeat protein [Chlamydiales bacterium]